MLAPIFLMLIAAALLGFAFWLWPRHPPPPTAIPPTHPAAPLHEPKTEYLSREDIFRPAAPPPSAPTEILTRPDSASPSFPATEYLSREQILAPPTPPAPPPTRDPDEMRPTVVFNRETIASIINKPR